MGYLQVIVGALVALFALAARAEITLSHFPPNPGVMPGGGWKWTNGTTFGDPPPQRAWVGGRYGAVPKVVASEAVSLAGKAGPMVVTAARSTALKDAAAAVARCLAGGGPVCAVGTAAAVAYAAWRFTPKQDGQANCADGMVCFDEGTNTESVAGYAGRFAGQQTPTECYGTAVGDVGQCLVGKYKAANPGLKCGVWYTTDPPQGNSTKINLWSYYWNGTRCVTEGGWVWMAEAGATQQTIQQCPASVDFGNPAYSLPAGMPQGLDGKCPTARYNHVGVSPTMAGDTIAGKYASGDPAGAPSLNDWAKATGDAVDNGGQTAPGEITSTGPATQTGAPKTTTTTNSQGTTVTTTTNTYNYTYSGDTITYNTTVTTVTTHADGSTETTTETDGVPDTEEKSECEKHPNTIGCAEFGDPPNEGVPQSETVIPWLPEDLGLPAACPPPYVIEVRGWDLTLDYTVACDVAPLVRPGLLALAALGCLFFVVAQTRR